MLGLRKGIFAGNEVGVSWKQSQQLPTTSLVDESSICGREEEKEEIIKILLSDNVTCNQVPIISIVGMGGMGKTTFTQLVYNDQRVLDQFDLIAWVYVSQDFDVVAVTRAILKALGSKGAEEKDLNLLQLQLKQTLMGNRFLLVLDDVWNEDYARSRIIITIRNEKVALIMNSSHLYHLKPLEKEDCWKLFSDVAFHDKDATKYPYLVSIGNKIVDKCGGLPLALKALGNILRVKFSQHEWVKILESDMWHLFDNDANINPALRLSYHNLPSYLKHCFAHCSIFPKGYEFDRDQLIQLWMAEGLLSCCQINMSEDELGTEFFNDLVARSFFQQSRHRASCFTMHDLLNDLAKSVSGEFCSQISDSLEKNITKRTCHISWSHKINIDDKFLEHTLLLLWCYHLVELPIDLHKLVNLRHLDMRMSGINKMPNHIGRLKHLRTLNSFFINKHDVKELGNLNNLQGTLSIFRCNENEDSILERQVLEALQPNGNLKKLSVLRYDGTSFPGWFGASHLPNLVSIALTESKFCFVLPPFGQLPSLKELSISCFYGIEVIGPEFCGNDSSNIPFRSLEILKFEEMSAWKEWCSFEGHS
ncbi:putative disease resistance RPP13-like protein 1 [Vigna unguiculata]|uniref:putative disease resistance RPP13-like protein 1 n=1 Tax=Vigna unguiculata TaxID=3917 RepID=UPI0010171F99|nr:putative disease resistance RPP13-like protein 1 [Vigna unguiculata]